ncbi:helix-turn-helix domain-containing protein [Henriciella sp.]|uniref:helix-turn-helix domain-containing protein n=1 Tax=Henriciella sp. TaxID=1968823 RepID=UPI002632515E|nr:helix-turn-helix transcriptional regulator [Henriciella sp.]
MGLLSKYLGKYLRSPAHQLLISEIKAARLQAGLSQQALAKRLGHPQSYIAKIETGERRIDVIEFLLLLNVLEISYTDMLEPIAKLLNDSW